METNPYAPPQVAELSSGRAGMSEAEAIRRDHLQIEATIKTAGTLHYIGMVLFGGLGLVMFAEGGALGLAFLLVGSTMGIVGYDLRHLNAGARWPALIISSIGLLIFPVGTIINGVILANLMNAKARTVFTSDYKVIIAATPHVDHGLSRLAILTLVLVGLIVIVAVAVPLFLRLQMS
ncbi:MAG: hypothetical protein V4662_04825 [Verrucomicrobiota bacterium]